jgi:hypothetical protein
VAIRIGAAAAGIRALAVGVAVAALSLPTLLAGGLRPPTSSPLDDPAALGNLARPLEPVQVAGIWGAGDFRFEPSDPLVTDLVIAVALLAAAAGLVWCLRRREPGPPLFVLGTLAGCALIAALGSPWVEGKAYATASVTVPFAAMLGVGWLAASRHRVAAAGVAFAVAAGVAWSAALAYRDASLGPYEELVEIEEIGARIAGQGPTLVTEYSPYAARHFLRDADPESISELRRRPIELRDGTEVPKGGWADTDRIDPAALAVYRTLVVRRSPVASRPPGQYQLIRRGEYYDAWQRAPDAAIPIADLPLGGRYRPSAVPPCAAVRRLAERASPGASLLASSLEAPIVSAPAAVGAIDHTLEVARERRYDIWLEGSVMPELEARVDGERVGAVRGRLANRGGWVLLGSVTLAPGRHRIEVELGGADLHPGSNGPVETSGRVALSAAEAGDARIVAVHPRRAGELCGREWDWIEVVGP